LNLDVLIPCLGSNAAAWGVVRDDVEVIARGAHVANDVALAKAVSGRFRGVDRPASSAGSLPPPRVLPYRSQAPCKANNARPIRAVTTAKELLEQPLIVEYPNGVTAPHPLLKVIREAEHDAARFAVALWIDAKVKGRPGRKPPSRHRPEGGHLARR
jgi:hypothetical protein